MGFYDKHGRYILMALTLLCMVGGVIVVAMGIWIAVAASAAAGSIIILIGLLCFSLYFLGFRGAQTNNRSKLKVFAWISIVVIVLGLIGSIINLTSGRRSTTHYDGSGSTVMAFINVAIQVLCVVLAFGLSSAIEQKAVPPPTYSTVQQT